MTLKNRIESKTKGYENAPLFGELAKLIIISAVVLWVTYKLASHKGIPSALIWIGAVILIYAYITKKTTMGRYLYAVGGNEKATALSGINTKNVFFFAYVNGQGYEMDAIAACFIGGASAYGGIGNVTGTIIGALLMGVINQGMSIMGVDANLQKVVKGLVLLIAVLFDVLSKKDKK